jgi:hypothetical protein
VHACVLPAWQTLGVWSGGDHVGPKDGSLGEHGPGGAEEWAQGSEILQSVKQWLCRPMGQSLACSTCCFFTKSWHGEAFHELGIQSADISALPCALPQPSVSPVSWQSHWFMELMQSKAVSQLPSWISPTFL